MINSFYENSILEIILIKHVKEQYTENQENIAEIKEDQKKERYILC